MQLLVQILLGVVITAAIYSFVAVGFSVIFSVARMFHFAHASIYPLAGYVAYSVDRAAGLPAGIAAGVIVAVVAAIACELVIYRPMRRRRANAATLMIASLGLQILLQGVIGSVWGTDTVYIANPFPTDAITLGPLAFTELELVTVVIAIIVVAAALTYLGFSKQGRALLAVAAEPSMAQVVGISESRMRLLAFALGTAISTPAAILVAFRSGLVPDVGNVPLLFAFAAVIVGGIGSVRGTILGLLLLLGASGLAVVELPTYWMQGIAFMILLAFMLWRPRGLLGRAQRSSVV